jgi:hypothetical protein
MPQPRQDATPVHERGGRDAAAPTAGRRSRVLVLQPGKVDAPHNVAVTAAAPATANRRPAFRAPLGPAVGGT